MGERILLVGILVLGACGGGASGEPLISGSMAGDWDGESFTAENGFGIVLESDTGSLTPIVAMGTGSLNCGSWDDTEPPDGHNIAFGLDADVFAVGEYSNVPVEMHRYVDGDYEGIGTNSGTVSLTSVTETSIAGTIAFDYTDNDARHFTANGSFEIVNCGTN